MDGAIFPSQFPVVSASLCSLHGCGVTMRQRETVRQNRPITLRRFKIDCGVENTTGRPRAQYLLPPHRGVEYWEAVIPPQTH